MMQNFKKITKVMAICALLVLSSCEKDLYDEAIQKDKNIQVKNISLSELSRKDNAKLFSSVDEVRNKKKNAQGKIVYDSINDIYFDDQSGKYIERADGYKSYTFPILKSGNGDTKIENIVFSLNEVGGYDVFKAKYDFTKEEMANFSEQQMTSHNVTYTEITQGKIGQIVCIETVSWQSFPIDSGDLTGNFGWTGAWVATSYHCYNMAENTGGFAGGGGDTDGPIGAPSTGNPTHGQSGAGSITTIAIPLTPTQEGMAAFMSHLSDPQLDWYHVQDEATLDSITNYLVQNSFSPDSQSFIKEMITACAINGSSFQPDASINSSNALSFSSVSEFQNSIIKTGNGFDVQSTTILNEVVSSMKFQINNIGTKLQVDIKQKLTPTYQVTSLTTQLVGIASFLNSTLTNYTVNNAPLGVIKIDVYDTVSMNITIYGYGLVVNQPYHITVLIDSTNGQIISSVINP